MIIEALITVRLGLINRWRDTYKLGLANPATIFDDTTILIIMFTFRSLCEHLGLDFFENKLVW